MEWNWFFSSLAQSAATITGIIGGFIIAKILSDQTDLSEKRKRLIELLSVAEKIKSDVNKTLLSHIESIRDNELLDRWEDVEAKKTILSLKSDARHQIRLISIFLDSIEGHPESPSFLLNTGLILVFFLFYFGVFLPLNFLPTPTDWVPPVFSSQKQMMRYLLFPFIVNPPFFWDDLSGDHFSPAIFDIKHVMLMAFFIIFSTILWFFFTMNYILNKIFMNSYDDNLKKLKLFKSIENYASEDYVDYFVNKC